MYSEEQMKQLTHDHSKAIVVLQEGVKSAHRRIDETDRITAGIHGLAKSIAEMATEVKLLTKRMDSSIERMEQSQKEQGARIGNIEKSILTISRNEKTIEEHEKRLDEIDKAPAAKWNKFTWLIFAGVVTAVVAFLMARVM